MPPDVERVRDRARAVPGLVDRIAEQARIAEGEDSYFKPKVEGSYLYRPLLNMLAPLTAATLVLEDEHSAVLALKAIEAYLEVPTQQWPPPARRDMRCHHSIPNSSALLGITMDICGDYWSSEAVASISERIASDLLVRFLVTWQKQDEFWATPEYNFNWKIMCCGDSGLGALACGESVSNLREVLQASLEGTLAVLDFIPSEGDWPEGTGYFLGSLRLGLRFALALRNATGGEVDIFAHPRLLKAGDFVMHATEPDNGFYDFADCPAFWPTESGHDAWGTMSLLAMGANRGEWARTVRMRDHWSLERLLWDNPELKSVEPSPQDTARHFPWTGVVTMRSGWDEDATFVGFMSGPNDKSHAHLDANSFVVSARGERLLVDEGTWPHAALLGFFDYMGPRFDFDALGTIGHNTLLVDGKGQHAAGREYGAEYFGKIIEFQTGAEVDITVGDATAAYAGIVDRYVRTIAFVKPDLVLIFDEVAASEPRYLEWLFHHDGEIDGDEDVTTIRVGEAILTLTRILPEAVDCWRTSDVIRTSKYINSDSLLPERPKVRYRSFGPFHPVEGMDVMWSAWVGDPDAVPSLVVTATDSGLSVDVGFADGTEQTVLLNKGNAHEGRLL